MKLCALQIPFAVQPEKAEESTNEINVVEKHEVSEKDIETICEIGKQFLTGLIEKMGVEAKVECMDTEVGITFNASGDKVRVSIRMKGRQQARPEIGVEVMNKFFTLVEDVAVIDKKPLTEGRNIFMILAPIKK